MDARGKNGPDLLRSTLVLHDEKGEKIGPMIRAGRPDRGMPAFGTMSDAQVADIAAFLHSGTNGISNRFGYEVKGLLTNGLEANPSAARGIGYREVIAFLQGRLEGDRLCAEIVKNTRALVKKQKTWFRTQLPEHRVVAAQGLREAAELFSPD